jgi:3-oxoacyl-[acyl-carrier protein] reductase
MQSERALEGKVALVTGASRGIGLAVAKTLTRLGAAVSICARDPKRLEGAAAQLKSQGTKILALPTDVTRANEITSFVERTERELGPIEVVVNNAGIGYFGPTYQAPESRWDSVLDTNLKAVFLLTKEVAPRMIERRSGHVINIGSLAGKSAFANGGIYCASKWGLLGLTYCLAEELRAHGIRVAAICPGSVHTEFGVHEGKDPRKLLQPEDVAHAVEMLITQAPQSFISEVLLRPTRKP